MADELWNQLQRAVLFEGLRYKDLPETGVLLFGALEGLGLNSYLDRMKLKKQVADMLRDEANLRAYDPVYPCTCLHEFARCGHKLSSSPAATMPAEVSSTSEAGRLSAPGLRGLAVACRVACELVAAACEEAMDASLWLRVPDAMHSIDASAQAYELMREVHEKHPRDA